MNMNKNDIVAGFSVFLLALPLCLGIAIASNFPPIAGIFTAIIGGMLASFCGSSSVTIKGPAAGMIVIVLGAMQELGSYQLVLAVGVVAAIIQIGIALAKKAVIAEIMPPSVIHGMLAAIGVIIIAKQAYVFVGATPTVSKSHELLFYFPKAAFSFTPAVFAIGLVAFCIMLVWPKIKRFSFIPSSIVILAIVIPLGLYLQIPAKYLINLEPQGSLLDAIQFPDFSQVFSPVSIKYILMFAIVGSIESLLTVCAVDSIRSNMKPSDLNKDLQAVGIANLVSASIGGLPMISEIVRSKANIDYGATSVWANFFHGFFMLLAVLFLPGVLNLIPLSALAAILIYVGLRLASPTEFKHAYEVGKDQFLIFLTTFLVTIFTDLLLGVVAGILMKFVLFLLRGNSLKSLFSPTIAIERKGDTAIVLIDGPLTFLSYMQFKNVLDHLVQGSKHVIISMRAVTYIDHTVMRKLQALHPQITIEDNQQLVQLYNHPLSTTISRKER